MIAALFAVSLLARQDPPQAVLEAPAGFTVELLDAAPNLRWPSAVHCLSDGSLLVAEDPMDMPGPTDQPLDRIWLYRWKEGGGFTRTLFAEKLYASFGLEEIDGAVYVMNMPHLTVLRDKDGDGVAEERKELLTDLGPDAPGFPGGFNDHIISGLRYGMDGWLYVACGDKGVPLAHGTDGSTLSLRGGGVIRLRPDGSKLEVVARGLRNILDVAMDANGEMFTYDNTDDGLGWWTRLTHVVPGGYYGYPWDYHDYPERFLAPLAEYGGGSPTGGLVKREGGWPAPYEGTLFFCEWGDQTLRNFQLERDGGTFKVAAMEEFLQAGKVKDFHPTDVCESPDGRFLYVSDWGFGGWVSKEETGRLWRVRRADDDGKRPGGVDARVGKIGARLASDGWRTRLLAQEEIIKTGNVEAMGFALQADERSALHALYATSAIARGMNAELSAKWAGVLDAIVSGKSPMTADLRRARAAVVAGFRKAVHPEDVREWSAEEIKILESASDLRAQQDAMLRLVKSADTWCASAESRTRVWKAAGLSPIAKHFWRNLASSSMTPQQFALFLDDGEAQAIELLDAVEGVALRMAETRRGTLEANPRGPFEDLEACGIIGLARGQGAGSNSRIHAKALHTLGVLARVCEPWDGKWWSIAPAKESHPAGKLDWRGTAIANSTLGLALAFPDDSVRKAALAAVIATGDERFAPDLRQRVLREEQHDLHLAAIKALGQVGSQEDGGLFARIARKSQDLEERLEALRIGARLAPEELLATALYLVERDGTPAKLQALALEIIAEGDRTKWEDASAIFALGVKRSRDSWPEVRRASCKVIALMDRDEALPLLLDLNRDPEVHSTAFEVLATLGDPRAARVFAQGLADQQPEVRSAARRAISRAKKELRPAFDGMVQRQEFSGAVVRELRGLYAGQQPILEWTIRGPCEVDAPEGKFDFTREHAEASLASLKSFEPRPAVSSSADGKIDLRKLLSEKSNLAAYAFAEFESATERDVELHVGSDDQVTGWLAGERVHVFDGARAFTAEADAFPAHLRAGKNSLVLRIGQVGGDWSFALTVPEEGSGPLFETTLPARPSVAEFRAFALEHQGDAAKGKAVLDDVQRTTCLRCHSLSAVGEHVGPDLAGLGARYSRSEIADSILSPSKRILDGYAAVSVLTKDDQLLFGQIKQDDARGIVLIDTTGTPIQIARDNVAEVRPSKLSVMPEGLCNTLTPAEFADLLAFLSKK